MGFVLRAIYAPKHNPRTIAGIEFPNAVGLGAGFDKNARFIHLLATLGFGHIEIGTVTPKAQDGNPKPRLFRLPATKALINRMGFNNDGVEAIANRLRHRPPGLVIGGNIGKNKVTPNEDAIKDYEICLTSLYDHVDYFTVNVSSPNTPGLRELQEKEPLLALLQHLKQLSTERGGKPIFLKIAPDLTDDQLQDVVEVVRESGIAGVIGTNTTLERKVADVDTKTAEEAGGLSGAPLTNRANEVNRFLCEQAKGQFEVMSSGGIMSARDAEARLQAGARAVQVWTGFIYEGPGLVRRIGNG
jgi:dihydroorotate dehydrogenase